MNIAIFFSGNGSNMLNIKNAVDEKMIKCFNILNNSKQLTCNVPRNTRGIAGFAFFLVMESALFANHVR